MPDYTQARINMVDCQVRPSDVTNLDLISAMLDIPRENFVGPSQKSVAYIDEDILLSTSAKNSPRYLMEPASFARLVQLAKIIPDAIVLDVGCASGYSSAILSRLCSSVVALEEDESLVKLANDNLVDLEIGNAVVLSGNLEEGFSKEGPYDSIFVGGAVDYIPDTILNQLKNGGTLVTVEGTSNAGKAVLYTRTNGISSKVSYFNCAVWPLPGFKKTAEFEF